MRAALILLLVLGACCPQAPALSENVAHALAEPFDAPGAVYQGDPHLVADAIFETYRFPNYHYVTTTDLYGSPAYWPTRSETRSTHKGDCKSFAVAAYYDALEAGIPESQLSIWVVVLLRTGEVHAVLVMGDLVIDRYFDRVSTLEEARHNYSHIVRFNHNGIIKEAP